MSQHQINQKIINNAVSAYLMLFVSAFFLFNKQNPYLNNDFVKNHTRSALLIHLGFLGVYILFIHVGFLGGIPVLGMSLHTILASVFCLGLLVILLFGAYKAKNAQVFALGEIIHVFKNQKISKKSENSQLLETEKLHFIMAHIPFIGFMKYPENSHKKYIFEATKLNLIITVLFIIFYGFGYINLANIFLLIYSIYIVFIGINIFSSNNIFTLQLDFFPHPEKKFLLTLAFYYYLKDYFSENSVKNFSEYYQEQKEKRAYDEKVNYERCKEKPDISGPKFGVYIPFVNLIYLLQKNKKQQIHIINGFILTLLTILSILIINIANLSSVFLYFIVIVIFYGFGYIVYNPVYKMPYIFIIYRFFVKIFGKTQKFNSTYNVEKEVHLKVKK